MAIANFTEGGKQRSLVELLCSKELIGGIHHQLICLSVVNVSLSLTAFLGNTLILVALHKKSSLHAPSKLLFRTLAITDLCVGIILEPLNVTSWISILNKRWNNCRYVTAVGIATAYILGSVSLLILTAISVERLLALLLGLRYRQVVTLKRTYVIITGFLVVAIVGTAMYFWNYRITLWYGCIGITMCLTTSLYSYLRIFFLLRGNRTQVQNVADQSQPSRLTASLNITRYRKSVTTALWVQLALVVCYLPYNIVEAVITHRSVTSSVFLAWCFAATLVFLNSSLNPILYCRRIREVRQAVRDTVRQLYCSCC